jgi:hypothetical protein
VTVFRVAIAVLLGLALVPLGGFADQLTPVAQFAVVSTVAFAATLVLPHYFYRGEPLLPDRHKKKR